MEPLPLLLPQPQPPALSVVGIPRPPLTMDPVVEVVAAEVTTVIIMVVAVEGEEEEGEVATIVGQVETITD